MARLRKFMFEHVYLGEAARREQERVTQVDRDALFDHLHGPPGRAPALDRDDDLATRVTDYIAGMTDRFCIRELRADHVPREFRY